ncbi:MAG: hypothetical protein Q8Q73_07665 [Stagnimonas sp.]|nr:hypothetical protein [Stagnimonas sp.]
MSLRNAQGRPGGRRDPVPHSRAAPTRLFAGLGLCWAISACGPTEAPAPARPAMPPLQPEYTAAMTPEVRAWADSAWPKVLANCAGLRHYREDLSAVPAGSRLVERYFEDRDAALIVAIRVAEQPAYARLREFAAQGHRCEFAIEYPAGSAVQIGQRWCQQLCLDRPIDSAGQDLRLGLR